MVKCFIYLLFCPQLIVFGPLGRIQKALEKKEYDKAHELIVKGIDKEPENAGIYFYKALLFFDEGFDHYNPDSARQAINKSIVFYKNAIEESKAALSDEGITWEKITKLEEKIRDQFFFQTLDELSIQSILKFRQLYPQSIYDEILGYKKDSIEYKIATQEATTRSLQTFIQTHPTSVFRPQADSLLDHLRWDSLSSHGTLQDFYLFLEKYPFSRYRKNVEAYILKVSTASHATHKYISFIQLSQEPALKKQAADVLFYLHPTEAEKWHPLKDSVRVALLLQSKMLFPVSQNGKIAFYDQEGMQKIAPTFSSILQEQKCNATDDDWIYGFVDATGEILTKKGDKILVEVNEYMNLGSGVGLVKQGESRYLYHKSGFKIHESPIDTATVVSGKWVKIKKEGKWGLVTLLGLEIAEAKYDDIYKRGSFWVFEKNGLLAVYTEGKMLQEIEDRGLSLEFKFDAIEMVNANAIIGFRGERECLLDSTLNFLVPWGSYEIYPEASGWYLKSEQGYRLYNQHEKDLMDRSFPYLESNEGWLALKTETDWMLIPKRGVVQPSRGYDSIRLVNNYAALCFKAEQKSLNFLSGKGLPLEDERLFVLPNQPKFIVLMDGKNTSLLDSKGQKFITGKFEKVSYLNDTLFKVQVRGKQGLLDVNGEWVLNPLFDMLDEKDGLILTLLNGKIGCYDPSSNLLISADFEARISRLGSHYIARKDGKTGLIDGSGQQVLSFSYEGIQHWNDTSYLVQKEGYFFIVNDREEQMYDHPLEKMQQLVAGREHAVYRFVADGKFGLISTKYGVLLDPEFSDIFNIGSKQEPLFFADQHLSRAGFHVVSYVNDVGKLILSRAYTRDEFDLILCDE